jgi:PAS domain S-box-containing protein
MSRADDNGDQNQPVRDDSFGTGLDDIPDAVLIADANTGRIVQANVAAGALFRCDPTDLIGRHQSELHPEEDRGDYREAFQRGVGGERVNRLRNGDPLFVETSGGELVPVEISVSRLERSGSEYIVGVFREVSSQLERERRLEAATSRLETLLDALPLPVAVLNTDGVVERWNRAAESTFGYAAETVVGNPYPLFVEDEEFDQLIGRVLDGGVLDGYETSHRARDGSRIPVELYARPIYEENELAGVVGTAVDLSDRQRRAQQLDVLHRVLRHNLRNRVGVVRGWAELLAAGDADPETATGEIVNASDRLLALSDQAKRIRTGITDDVQAIDPLPVGEAVSRLSALASDRDGAPKVSIAENPEVETVPRRGFEAVSELFEAVLAHCEEGPIQLLVHDCDQFQAIELHAAGSLLPSGERSLIETGGETALEHGSGLGVAQAYLVVQSIGGAVTVESREGAPPACTLRIELPRPDGEDPLPTQ